MEKMDMTLRICRNENIVLYFYRFCVSNEVKNPMKAAK